MLREIWEIWLGNDGIQACENGYAMNIQVTSWSRQKDEKDQDARAFSSVRFNSLIDIKYKMLEVKYKEMLIVRDETQQNIFAGQKTNQAKPLS